VYAGRIEQSKPPTAAEARELFDLVMNAGKIADARKIDEERILLNPAFGGSPVCNPDLGNEGDDTDGTGS